MLNIQWCSKWIFYLNLMSFLKCFKTNYMVALQNTIITKISPELVRFQCSGEVWPGTLWWDSTGRCCWNRPALWQCPYPACTLKQANKLNYNYIVRKRNKYHTAFIKIPKKKLNANSQLVGLHDITDWNCAYLYKNVVKHWAMKLEVTLTSLWHRKAVINHSLCCFSSHFLYMEEKRCDLSLETQYSLYICLYRGK